MLSLPNLDHFSDASDRLSAPRGCSGFQGSGLLWLMPSWQAPFEVWGTASGNKLDDGLEEKKYPVFDDESVAPIEVTGECLYKRLASKSDATLRREAQIEAVTPSNRTAAAVAFSQMELDRREALRQERLIKKTTLWSATIGATAGIAGAIIGAVLTVCLGG